MDLTLGNKRSSLPISNNRVLTIQSSTGLMQVIVTITSNLPTGSAYKKVMGLVLQDSGSGDSGFYYNIDGNNWVFFSRPFSNDTVIDLSNKVDKITGKGLSTNDYINGDKSKVDNLPLNTNSEISNLQSQVDTKLNESQVDARINNIIDGAPAGLDTLNELANALADDQDALAVLVSGLGNKVDKEVGKGLSTEDYTTVEKNKLTSLENYDDSTIILELSNIQSDILDLQTDKVDKDGTKVLSDINFSTADKDKLDLLENYDDTVLTNAFNLSLGFKVDKVTGKELSDNNYDDADKAKVDGLGTLASKDTIDYETEIDNLPTIPTALSELSPDSANQRVSSTEKTTWNNKSSFSGSYNDLSNLPNLALKINVSEKGAINGVAPLDNTGKIIPLYLPVSESDIVTLIDIDTIEPVGTENDIYYNITDNKLYEFISSVWVDIGTPLVNRLYNDLMDNLLYRYNGVTLVSTGGIALGTTNTTAYRGDLGTKSLKLAKAALGGL